MKRESYFACFILIIAILISMDFEAQILPNSVLKDEDDEQTLQSWLGQGYQGVLLYRKSIHGASSAVFHERCDGQGPTIVLIRNTQNNVVFGGYGNGDWMWTGTWQYGYSYYGGYYEYQTTSYSGGLGSFLFNLNNNVKFDYQSSGQNNAQTQIGNTLGPTFTNGFQTSSNMSYINVGNMTSYCSQNYNLCRTNLFGATGQTSVSDYLYDIGEIEVYKILSPNQVNISLTQPNILAQCPNDQFSLTYNVIGSLSGTSELFDVQWSNSSGNFVAPVYISQALSLSSGQGNALINVPSSVAPNANYKIRFRRQSDSAVSNAVDVNIKNVFNVDFTSSESSDDGVFCNGESYNFSYTFSDCVPLSGINWTLRLQSNSQSYNEIVGTSQLLNGILSISIPTNAPAAQDYILSAQLSFNGQDYYQNFGGVQVGNSTSITNINTLPLCYGDYYSLAYAFKGCDLPNTNQFQVQLSDASGSFLSPIILGILSSQSNSGMVEFSLPSGLQPSNLYALRIVPSGINSGVWQVLSGFMIGSVGQMTILIDGSSTLCPGAQTLNYSIGSTCPNAFGIGNVFNVEMSSTNGTFENPIVVGALSSSDPNGSISFNLPINTPASSNYSFRVVSSNPVVVSNSVNRSVGLSSIVVNSNSGTCVGLPYTLNYTASGCTIGTGNVFTMQYYSTTTSSWVNVATLSSTALTGSISYTIPGTWLPGYYDFRIISSLPQSVYADVQTVQVVPRTTLMDIDIWNVGIGGSRCPGGVMTVPFVRTGDCPLPAVSGNIYRVQISATSDFATPVVIGSLTSTANTGTISCTIPAGYAGNYFVRVIGTSPVANSANYYSISVGCSPLYLNLATTEICPGQSITMGYSNGNNCTYGAGNQIKYELSNANGEFTSPVVLATYNTTAASTNHTFVFPAGVTPGLNYYVRVSSSNPARVSSIYNLFVGRKTSIVSGINSNYCTGTNYIHNYQYTGCTLATGNVFTAQICATSDFSSAVYNVGALTSNANSGSITVNIPNTVVSGSYFLRVKSSIETGAIYSTYPIVIGNSIIDNSFMNVFAYCSGIPHYLQYSVTSCQSSPSNIQMKVLLSYNFTSGNYPVYELYNGSVSALNGTIELNTGVQIPIGDYRVKMEFNIDGSISQSISGFVFYYNGASYSPSSGTGLSYGGGNSFSSVGLNSFCSGGQFTLSQINYYSCAYAAPNQYNNTTVSLKLVNLSNPSIPAIIFQTYQNVGIIPTTNFTLPNDLIAGDIYSIVLENSVGYWGKLDWDFIISPQYNLTYTGNLPGQYCPGQNVSLNLSACSLLNPNQNILFELSNEMGNFENPDVLLATTIGQATSGAIVMQLPDDLIIGGNYAIRMHDVAADWNSNSVLINLNGVVNVSGIASNYCPGETVSIDYNFACSLPAGNQFEILITNTTKQNSSLIAVLNSTSTNGMLSFVLPSYFPGGIGYKLWIRSIQNPNIQSALSLPFGVGLNTSLQFSGNVCRGISTSIAYNATGCDINPGNVFQVMLGDIVVGSILSSNAQGNISITIPIGYESSSANLRIVSSSPVQTAAQSLSVNLQNPITLSLPSNICSGSSIVIPYTVNCSLPANNSIQVFNGDDLLMSTISNTSGNLSFVLPLTNNVQLRVKIVSSEYNILVFNQLLNTQSYSSMFDITATPDFVSGCGTTAQLLVSPNRPLSISDNFETGPNSGIWDAIEGANPHEYYVPGYYSGGTWGGSTYWPGYWATDYGFCGVSGSRSLLFTNSTTRYASTVPINVSNGGTIAFKLKISNGAEADCEDANPGEEVYLQYSLNMGNTWTAISTYNTTGTYNNLTSVSVAIPTGARSFGTMFRWIQASTNEFSGDNWVLDDVSITGTSLTTFPCNWNNANTLNSATIKNPLASPSSTTTYAVSITALNFACPVVKEVTVTTANQIGVDPAKFTYFGTNSGKVYYTSNQTAPWSQANTDCINSCGNLVSVNSVAEQNFVQTILPSQNKWIGASDAATEATFVWTTGQTFSAYTNWVSGTTVATSNSAVNDHVQMNANTGKWQVASGTLSQHYILERAGNHAITISNGLPLSYCSGDQLSVGYSIAGVFDANNVFSVQLSDASGSFSNPQIIGSLNSDVSGSILISMPTLTSSASGYRMRIVSTSPMVVSSDNGINLLLIGTSPTISSLSSNQAQAGSQLTIYGSGFSSAGNTVSISGVNASIVSQSPSQITVVVPGGLCPGVLTIETGCGYVTNSVEFDPLSTPFIASTTEQIIGGSITVTVTGYGFTYNQNQIFIDNDPYTPFYQSPNLLRFITSGIHCNEDLTIINGCNLASNIYNYATQLSPSISSINPAQFQPGDTISINGNWFSNVGNSVSFGGQVCEVVYESISVIQVVMPATVCSGSFHVTNQCDVDVYSSLYFASNSSDLYYSDMDLDGFGSIDNDIQSCFQPTGFVMNALDCNDFQNSVFPGAIELCNDWDDDCDGSTNEGVENAFFLDADGDGFGGTSNLSFACTLPIGYSENNLDCNDNNDNVSPSSTELCNTLDDDCDGVVDEDVQIPYFLDTDGDLYGDTDDLIFACSSPVGYVANGLDCDDQNMFVYPGSMEQCNLLDDDCDGNIDEDVQNVYFADSDNDSYGDVDVTALACAAPAGFADNSNDCDDFNGMVFPTAAEICNQADDNCNVAVDEGLLFTVYYEDIDGDSYGSLNSISSCQNPGSLYVNNYNDCSDNNALIYPGSSELCNLLDDDCDGLIDEEVQTTFYFDGDGDGYGVIDSSIAACSLPVSFVGNHLDCNDDVSTIHPFGIESCNLTDDNCDGFIDEGVQVTYFQDTDNDGYGIPGNTIQACSIVPGYSIFSTDCADNNPNVFPNTIENCNNLIDDNCNGFVNESCGNLIQGDDVLNALNVSVSAQFGTGVQSSSSIPLVLSTDSPQSAESGADFWVMFTPQSNAVRVAIAGDLSINDDNELSLYNVQENPFDLMIPLSVEDNVHPGNSGIAVDSGDEILLTDQLIPGTPYWLCIRNVNNQPGICKLRISNLMPSQSDIGPYTNYTGIYNNVCQNFKVKFRPNAKGYTVHRLVPSSQTEIDWSYSIPAGNGAVASTICQLGRVFPSNLTDEITYRSVLVDVTYQLTNAFGNVNVLTANGYLVSSIGFYPESDLFLRSIDQCPSYKNINSSIATNRSVCGTKRYQWSFLQNLPSQSAFDLIVDGALGSRILPVSAIPGIANDQQYDVQLRALHGDNSTYSEWGSDKCFRTYALAGMPLETESFEDNDGVIFLYPNPNSGELLNILGIGEANLSSVVCYSMLGEKVFQVSVEGNKSSIDLPIHLSNGIYHLVMTVDDRNLIFNLIIQR